MSAAWFEKRFRLGMDNHDGSMEPEDKFEEVSWEKDHKKIHEYLDDEDWSVRRAAAGNKNATKENLDKALSHEDCRVRQVAAGNKNATKENLDKALGDKHSIVRRAATDNPKYKKFYPHGHESV
jgi:HEAT repeat protein